MTLFPKSKDLLAKKRGLVQTVDGVHYTSITAKVLANEIEELNNIEIKRIVSK